MKQTALILAVFCSLLLMTAPLLPVQATNIGSEINRQMNAAGTQTQLSNRDPRELTALIIKAILGVLGMIAVALIVYAGFLWLTSQGEETEITKAKDTLKAAIIGLLVILAAYALTRFVLNSLITATH